MAVRIQNGRQDWDRRDDWSAVDFPCILYRGGQRDLKNSVWPCLLLLLLIYCRRTRPVVIWTLPSRGDGCWHYSIVSDARTGRAKKKTEYLELMKTSRARHSFPDVTRLKHEWSSAKPAGYRAKITFVSLLSVPTTIINRREAGKEGASCREW